MRPSGLKGDNGPITKFLNKDLYLMFFFNCFLSITADGYMAEHMNSNGEDETK